MAGSSIFTFYPEFKEFLPVYRNVARVWIGDGVNTGTSGILYAEYADGNVAEIGSVSLYATAQSMGYTGTERDWVNMIISVAELAQGATVDISYQTSPDGTTPPSGTWTSTPTFIQGEYTWAKLDLWWFRQGTAQPTSTFYFASYQGVDGSVQSVNGNIGNVTLHGENLPIGANNNLSIKDYIDTSNIPDIATNDEIDALFSMTFFSGAAIITGRQFAQGDSITYEVEAVTQNAPLPTNPVITISPTSLNSCHFSFGNILYKLSDIPAGDMQKTYTYKIKERQHTLNGVTFNSTYHIVSVTLINPGDGTVKISLSENFNKLYFVYKYTAEGCITFEGTMTLNGRSMAPHEFNVEIKEGNTVIATGISSINQAAQGQAATIAYPVINYTLEDIGTHVYTVRQTSISGSGVTIDQTVHTVTVYVRDDVLEDSGNTGELEITTDGTDKNVNFVNTYAATGTVTFSGSETISNRTYKNTDAISVSVTSVGGRLPSPATVSVDLTVGESSADFAFAAIQYTLSDMANPSGGYFDEKTFEYTVTELLNIPGATQDGLQHTITVRLVDNKLGSLIPTITYSDGNSISFTDTYNAYGSLTIQGEKRLLSGENRVANRPFIASDTMHVTITSTNGGRLPYYSSNVNVPLIAGQTTVTFNFLEMTYDCSDLKGGTSYTYNYIVTEDTTISGAYNDNLTHTLSVYIEDNFDGTIAVTPAYSDGNKLSFVSVYNATGNISLVGVKSIVNRAFKSTDRMNAVISTTNSGNLPVQTNVAVPLTAGSTTANFSYAPITYRIDDLNGASTRTFNYTVTESASMEGTAPVSISDTVSVVVTDTNLGSLNVSAVYTNNSYISLTNVYTAEAYTNFTARCVFTNGNMINNPFTVRITQVTGNNSTTQETTNVVLAAPITMAANAGETQDLNFTNAVHFVKNSSQDDTQHTYWFMIEEVLPNVDANNIYNNVRYDANKKWINISVADNLDGTLTVTKNPAQSAGLDMTFTNEQLADLTIAKVWTGDDNRLTSAEKNAFTFVVTGPNSYTASFLYSDMTNDAMVLSNLALGSYTVVESNNTVENFNITTTYSVSGNTTDTIALTRGGGQINVTNNVNKLEGTLNIVKTWSGDHSLLTEQQKNAVTFTVTGPKQKSTDQSTYSNTFTYAQMTNGTMTISQLTLGTYTVVESNSSVQDFDVTVTYTVDAAASSSVAIEDGESKTITVNGAYAYHTGTVKVTKSFDGISTLPVGFSISNDYDDSVFTYANADNASTADGTTIPYEWTISNVPVHMEIEFTESGAGVTDYTLTTTALPADRTCEAVEHNATSTVDFTNIYTPET